MDLAELMGSKTVKAIFDHYESKQEGPRPHLGASIIGKSCERAIWYDFHWATYPKFTGRILRLFERGQREETILVKNLRDIGVVVWEVDPTTGKQIAFKAFGGHFAGSCDGIARGLPDSPNKPHVLEFKTSNTAKFKQLQKMGVEQTHPQHYAQMQVYMKAFDIDRAFYMAVCKETDEIYAERLHFSLTEANNLFDRALRIIQSQDPMGKISDDPAYYECKLCNHWDICHGGKLPEVNCKTCAHSTPELSGGWSCLENHEMVKGCANHIYHPVFFKPLEVVDFKDNTLTLSDGTANGKLGFSSENLKELWGTTLTSEKGLIQIQEIFGSTVKKAWNK